jgi:4-methyl-5(b-hydroxyethyl)-thiazole monophosphate biosynthesis
MAQVLMPLAQGFEEIEAITIVDVLRRAEIEVVLAGLVEGLVVGAHNIAIMPDAIIDAVTAAEFDMIVLPGGQPGTDNLNADPRIHVLLNDFAAQQKLIGAICAAPIVLAATGLLTGKHVTCYPTYRDRLNGGIYEEQPVVTDGNLITSRGVGTAMDFALEIVTRLSAATVSDALAKTMLVADKTP